MQIITELLQTSYQSAVGVLRKEPSGSETGETESRRKIVTHGEVVGKVESVLVAGDRVKMEEGEVAKLFREK